MPSTSGSRSMEISLWPFGTSSLSYVLKSRLVLVSHLLASTVASSGRNSQHSVNGCSTNTPERSCSELQVNLLSISVSERINTSNVLPWLLNRIAPYRYSLTWTCHLLYGRTTNTGLYRFMSGLRYPLTCYFDQQCYQPVQ